MPQSLKFTLQGKQAMFKKPDVNQYAYFTYNNIHKVALIGMIGAIIGLKGWRNYQLFGEKEPQCPEFYETLSKLQVSISPVSRTGNGYFPKKVQSFNNSTGHASNEDGGILQVLEQVLENPKWTIYILQGGVENDIWNKICEMMLSGKTHYIPYLGKNDYPADIEDVQLVEITPTDNNYCNSLFPAELHEIDEYQCLGTFNAQIGSLFTEVYPVALDKTHNNYLFQRFVFTNYKVKGLSNLYADGEQALCFF